MGSRPASLCPDHCTGRPDRPGRQIDRAPDRAISAGFRMLTCASSVERRNSMRHKHELPLPVRHELCCHSEGDSFDER